MNREKNVLIITDDENSETVRKIQKHNVIPITRRSILAAIEFLRHYKISAIIIDKEHQNVDPIEFILNARDIIQDIPIFIPDQLYEIKYDGITKLYKKIIFYENPDQMKNTIVKHININ